MSDVRHCPDCGNDVPAKKNKCGCGYIFFVEEKRESKICEVNGCPDVGTLSPSTGKGGPWYCRHHWAIRHGGKFVNVRDDTRAAFNHRLREIDEFIINEMRTKLGITVREASLNYMKRKNITPPVFDESEREDQREREAIQTEGT